MTYENAKLTTATLAATFCLGVAAMAALVAPASECGTPQLVDPLPALPFFLLYLVAGTWVVRSGTERQRLFLFAASAFIMTGYVLIWYASLDMLYSLEIHCAQQGLRPEP